MKKILVAFFLLTAGCTGDFNASKEDKIIAEAIEKAGGDSYDKAKISFVFRKRRYTSTRDDGRYEFTRTYEDSTGIIKDVLTNEGVTRYRNGEAVPLSDSLAGIIGESVNSVHYFVQLPYGLDGPAVQKRLIGLDRINGKTYYEMEVTFRKEGGGKDHEDVYMYWIDKQDFSIDYMAYRFFVNEGGIRFRVAVNPRVIEGIRFVDYVNYKTNQLDLELSELDELYEADQLIKVSDIVNEVIRVEVGS